MRIPITSYTFDPANKTLTLTKYSSSKPFDLRSLHNITDNTTGQVLYTLYNSNISNITVSNGNVLTFDKLPSGVQSTDDLNISIEVGATKTGSADFSNVSSDIVPSADITYSLGSSLTSRFKYAYAQRLWMNTGAYIESTAASTIYVGGSMNVTAGLRSDNSLKIGSSYSSAGTDALSGILNGVNAISNNVLWGFKGFSGQTADLTRWISSGNTVLAKVDANGNITGTNLSGTNTGDQTATTVANTPAGNITSTNVQTALNELDTKKLSKAANDTAAGIITFTQSPLVPTPTTANQAVNKSYADGLVSAGAPDATTTTKGIVQLAGDLSGSGTTAAAPKVNFANDTVHLLKGSDSFTDGAVYNTGTTTGVQFGSASTQKLGFFGAAPVTQRGATSDLGTVMSDLGFRPSSAGYTLATSGQIQANGALRTSQSTLTGATTLAAGTANWTNLCDATGGAFTVTLTATANKGYRYTFVKIDSTTNAITISAGAGTINGVSTYSLPTQYKSVTVESTGTSGVWYVVGIA